jgi:hypothetical protein
MQKSTGTHSYRPFVDYTELSVILAKIQKMVAEALAVNSFGLHVKN